MAENKAVHPLIAAALAMPKTHRVVSTWPDGHVIEFDTRNQASAENHAAHMLFRGAVTVEVIRL